MSRASQTQWIGFGFAWMAACIGCSDHYDVEVRLINRLASTGAGVGEPIPSKAFDCLWIAYCLESTDAGPGCSDRVAPDFEDQYQFVRIQDDDREGPGPDLLLDLPPYDPVTIAVTATIRPEGAMAAMLGKGAAHKVEIAELPEKNGAKQLTIDILPCASPTQCWDRCPKP